MEIEADGVAADPDLIAFPFESALEELSADAFPVVATAGASTLKVKLHMALNDNHNSILEGTSMRSYAARTCGRTVQSPPTTTTSGPGASDSTTAPGSSTTTASTAPGG